LIYVAIALNSNCWRLGSASQMISSSWMTPSWHLLIPWVSGLMISIMAFGKLVVEQKL
jgi:hypothetical protein